MKELIKDLNSISKRFNIKTNLEEKDSIKTYVLTIVSYGYFNLVKRTVEVVLKALNPSDHFITKETNENMIKWIILSLDEGYSIKLYKKPPPKQRY